MVPRSFMFGVSREMPRNNFVLLLQLIQAAMGVGVVAFAGVILFLHHSQPATAASPAQASEIVRLISLANAGVFCLCVLLAAVLPGLAANLNRLFRRHAAGAAAPESGELERGFQSKHGTASLLRLASLECSAMMGLTVCLLGVLDGSVRADPVYWCNALPAAAFILYVIGSFPTAGRVDDIFQRKLARARSGFA